VSDRNPSFFGPVLDQEQESAAFTHGQLARIAERRREADKHRKGPSAWPAARTFATLMPPPLVMH
jgi:hypothetical protein